MRNILLDYWRCRVAALVVAGFAIWGLGGSQVCGAQATGVFATAVEATHPIAFYRLDGTTGTSVVGTTTYKASGGVSSGTGPGAPIGVANNKFAMLDGHDGYILTTQVGGEARLRA